MKKTLLLLTFILCSLTLSATTYEVYYDINTKQEANLLITVNNNTLKVGQKVYPLRLLGHINNGNVVYASYAYDTTQKDFLRVHHPDNLETRQQQDHHRLPDYFGRQGLSGPEKDNQLIFKCVSNKRRACLTVHPPRHIFKHKEDEPRFSLLVIH